MIDCLEGFTVGNYTDSVNGTGCTVVLCPPGSVASCEVRGNSPGSRELALLSPEKSMNEIHAILLTGGSAFGLAAADGVVRYLEETGIGYTTPWATVPIVPAAVVFDLNVGSASIRPGSPQGYEACKNAKPFLQQGLIGAGAGATVGKWAGFESHMKGGTGVARIESGELQVACLSVVNAVGDVIDTDGKIIAGARDKEGKYLAVRDPYRRLTHRSLTAQTNTTLSVIMTNAKCSKLDAFRIAQRVHDGYARAIIPVHTMYDGDVSFVVSHGAIESQLDLVAELSASAAADAIRNAVRMSDAKNEIAGAPSR